jgi:hypothetical protein
VFESISTLRPYFHSLREIQDNVSLDIKLPLTWRYEDVIKPYSAITYKVQDKNEKFNLVSLISKANQTGYDVVFACANEIAKVNREEEEKQKLFQQKVKELQELFKNETLDKLKDLNLLETHGQEDTTSIGDITKGDGEGQDGSGELQEEDD